MRNPKPSQTSPFAAGLDEIKGICDALNTEHYLLSMPTPQGLLPVKRDYRPIQRELRRLVQAWFDSGPNIKKLFDADPVLKGASQVFDAYIIPTTTGLAHVVYTPVPRHMDVGPLSTAIGLFLGFLLNPFNGRLAGPCKECGRYYIRKTKRQNTYCSQKCGRKRTSRESNLLKAKNRRQKEIQRAQQALSVWSKGSRKENWKAYVHRVTRISKNLLTRTVAAGELVVPDPEIKK